MEKTKNLNESNNKELIWTLEHEEVFTAGNNYKENEILDKSIKIFKTNRWKNYLSWAWSTNILFCN